MTRMAGGGGVVVLRGSAGDAGAIGDLYLAAWADALPYVTRVHSDDAVRIWIRDVVLKRDEVWVARSDGHVVGFMSRVGDDLNQLHVLPGFYRRGIGSRLLARAKADSLDRLRLYTFQRNTRARAFYEAHGFVVVSMNDGSRNEEREPDVLYEWRA